MDKSQDEEIMNNIVNYAEKYDVKGMLKEYMRRLVLKQPDNPLEFLMKSITDEPYKIPGLETTTETFAPAPEAASLPF